MSPTLAHALNAVMRPVLRSPVHFLVSGWCMLITVTGRKTGRHYTTPVYYRQDAGKAYFFSGSDVRWIRNLTGGAPVELRLRGRVIAGAAQPVADADLIRQQRRLMYPRMDDAEAAEMTLIQVQLAD